jgi:hypothetical protein
MLRIAALASSVDAYHTAAQQALLGEHLEHEGEDLLMRLDGQSRTDAREARMIRRRLAKPRKLRSDIESTQRHAIPRSLTRSSKVPSQQHPHVHAPSDARAVSLPST